MNVALFVYKSVLYRNKMDLATNTEHSIDDLKLNQENTLLEIVKEICSESDKLSPQLKGKVGRIIAGCDLKLHSSLQRVNAVDKSTSIVLDFMHQTVSELSYEEQAELNQAFIEKIEKKLPPCIAELEALKKTSVTNLKIREDQLQLLRDKNRNLETLQDQETEQMNLMMEWLSHRINAVAFEDNTSELFNLKVKILNLKSKILHLQTLQNIFTETNQSLKAYTEVHKDLKQSIKETEQRIKNYREIIDSEF